MGIDAQIASALADRQIEIFRFDASVSNYAIRQLNQLEKKSKGILTSFSDVLTNRQAKEAKLEIRELVKATYFDIDKYTADEFDGFGNHEAEVTAALLSQITGKNIKSAIVKDDPNINGVDLSEYWQQTESGTVLQTTASISKGVIDNLTGAEIAGMTGLVIAGRKNGAKSYIRTSSQSLANAARQAVYERNSVIEGYIHTSVLDSATTVICLVRANSVWDLHYEPMFGTTEPFARPPLHFGCRSFLRPYMGYQIEHIAGKDWLLSKSPDLQDKLLGKGRADLWRREVITWSDLLNQQGRPLTLKELKSLH